MKTHSIFGIFFLIMFTATSQAQKPAYKLYNAEGKKAKYEELVEAAADADVILFGEQHDDPVAHWLQHELTADLFELKGEDLILGAEMFETDNQLILNEYLQGLISEDKFEDEARLWPNYMTDYKPLVKFAKVHGIKFIATNVPRRYANSVYKRGLPVLDSLSDEARSYMAPLPLMYDTALNCYSSLINAPGGHGGIDFADSQALKDATMAHSILINRKDGKVFLHFNGAYHSDNFESINYFLKRAISDLKILTISNAMQKDIRNLADENKDLADFIITVPESMTRTR